MKISHLGLWITYPVDIQIFPAMDEKHTDLIFQDIDVILQGCDVLVVLVQSVLEGLIGQFRRCTSGQQQGRTCQECK